MPHVSRVETAPPIKARIRAHHLGGRPVLGDIELVLGDHRIGLVGRNGSGKSTLLRCLAGLIAPDEGCVTIGGVDLARDRQAAIRQVGILFQNPDHQIIFPTVGEEIGFGLRQIGHDKAQARQRCLALLDSFGCADWLDRVVSELSQGQRHLVCLLSVLAMSPSVILLDEPFAGLDIPTTTRLRHILTALPQRVIQVSHDLAALTSYDRLIWIDGGGILEDGPPDQVLHRYILHMRDLADADARILD